MPVPFVWGQTLNLSGVVSEVRGESGDARVRSSDPFPQGGVLRGQIQTRTGPVQVRIVTRISANEVWVQAERRGEMERVSPGDRVLIFTPAQAVLEESQASLDRIRRILEAVPPSAPSEESLSAPDFLEDVSGEVLDDYESWLLQLETEQIAPSSGELEGEPIAPKEPEILFYPDIQTDQRLETGVDYDRYVFSATQENAPTRQIREQIGRYLRWNFSQDGDLDPWRYIRFENEVEANDVFVQEDLDFLFRRDLGFGDRLWWRSRSQWRNYLNDQGDPFYFEDFETRRIDRLNDRWERQVGVRAVAKKEYNTDSDDGYLRGTLLYELNYRDELDKWFDLTYEYTEERRTNRERFEQDYSEHRVHWQYFSFGEESDFDLYGETYYRDYNQPGTEEDELLSLFTGTTRKKIDDHWTYGLRGRLEPRYYPTTEDMNSNAIGVELSPFVEYTDGESLFVTLEPRIAQVFHLGTVPDDIFLSEGLPRERSDGDYREGGLGFTLSWYPGDHWRINLFEDLYHRWFPAGETGESAFYLFDFPRIADSTNLFSSLTIDYLFSEDFEISLRASHTKQIYRTYDENDTDSINVGIDATYYY